MIDTAILNAGSINLTSSTLVGEFQQSGGVFTSPVEVTLKVLENLEWSGGQMRGGGTTDVAIGATLNVTGAGAKTLDQLTLNNAGAATWSGPGPIDFLAGASFINSGSFTAQNDAAMRSSSIGGNGSFTNAGDGIFTKNTGTNSSLLEIAFTNDGTLNVETGTLVFGGIYTQTGAANVSAGGVMRLNNGGSSGGDFALSPGALLQFSGGTFLLDDSVDITGAGIARLDGATLTIGDNAADHVNVANLSQFVDALGGPGLLTIGQSLTWSGGTMSGTGTTEVEAGATLSITGGSVKTLSQRTFNNAGAATWSGAGTFDFSNNATFVNSGSFTAQSDSIIRSISGSNTFTNEAGGTFANNTGTTGVQIDFANAGIVNVPSGTLNFTGAYTQSAGRLGFRVEVSARVPP